jgi:hypothetical protein
MAFDLVGGWKITIDEPVDARFVVTSSLYRFGIDNVDFTNANTLNGLTTYATSSHEYFVLVDKTNRQTNIGWRQLPLTYVTSSVAAVSATTTLYTITTGSQTNGTEINYHSAHSDYQIYDGNGTRAGSILASFNGSSLDYTDFSNAGTGDQANHIDIQVALTTTGIEIKAVNADGAKTPTVKISTRLL